MTVRNETSAESAARFQAARIRRIRGDDAMRSFTALLLQLADRLDSTPRRVRDFAAAVLPNYSRQDWHRVDDALERLCDYGIARWTRHGYVRGPVGSRRITEGR